MEEEPKSELIRSEIQIKRSPIHRYGVFANKDFLVGELIEQCLAVVYQKPETIKQGRQEIYDREFVWDDKNNALFLGYGEIYNHSRQPNAKIIINPKSRVADYVALKPIQRGEEIFISYKNIDWFEQHNKEELKMIPLEKQNNKVFVKVFGFIGVLLLLSKIFPLIK